MTSNKVNYVVVGGFVIAMLAALMYTIALLSGRTGETESYHTIYDNVSGVAFGTKVLFEGFHVGQVENVTPEVEDGVMHFRIDLSIFKDWKIPQDSIARKHSGGILSALVIAIEAGQSKEMLPAGSLIQPGDSASLFDAMSGAANEAGDVTRTKVRPLLDNMNEQVNVLGKLLREDIPKVLADLDATVVVVAGKAPVILGNLEDFTQKINALVDAVDEDSINATLANLEAGTGNFVTLSQDLKGTGATLNEMIISVDEMIKDNRGNVDGTLVDMRYSMKTVARHIDAILRNLEGTSRHMNEFSRQIRLNPGLLLGGSPPKDEASATSASSSAGDAQ